MATVIIPTPLRKFTSNHSRVEIKAATIGEAVDQLTSSFPELKKHLIDEKGKVRSFINIFLGSEDVRNLQEDSTLLKEDSVVSIVPAIAGGIW